MRSRLVPLDSPAPDFALQSTSDQTVRLSDFRGRSAVVLVFLRGFQ